MQSNFKASKMRGDKTAPKTLFFFTFIVGQSYISVIRVEKDAIRICPIIVITYFSYWGSDSS